MARVRQIKPGFFKNEDLSTVPFETRLLYIGLWGIADREGRLEDRPQRIGVEVFPYDKVDVENSLCKLAGTGQIVRYVADGTRYISIPTWPKHQNPHKKEVPSTIPAPTQHQAETCLALDWSDARSVQKYFKSMEIKETGPRPGLAPGRTGPSTGGAPGEPGGIQIRNTDPEYRSGSGSPNERGTSLDCAQPQPPSDDPPQPDPPPHPGKKAVRFENETKPPSDETKPPSRESNVDPLPAVQEPRQEARPSALAPLSAIVTPFAEAKGIHAVETPSEANTAEFKLMQRALVLYVDGKLPFPDDDLVRKVLAAGNGASANRIFEYLRILRQGGATPQNSNGPKGWGWFPHVVRAKFATKEQTG